MNVATIKCSNLEWDNVVSKTNSNNVTEKKTNRLLTTFLYRTFCMNLKNCNFRFNKILCFLPISNKTIMFVSMFLKFCKICDEKTFLRNLAKNEIVGISCYTYIITVFVR